ncbi:MAG: methyltransferase family protein, partial [Verrucomicrobiales bacterium]
IVSATAMFGAIHTALASRQAKELAARCIGERNRDAYYRLFFNLQSVVASAALLLVVLSQPDRKLWRVSWPTAILFNAVRAGCLWGMVLAVRQIGFARVSGLQSASAHLRKRTAIPLVPEAQGPALDAPMTGPFRFTRHPLNFLAIPLIWLAPRITRNRFVLNCAATLYFLLGSIHEERRMRQAWGSDYEAYRRQTRFLLGPKS